MARKITVEAVNAFIAGLVFNKDNTSVEVRQFKGEGNVNSILKLHGNVIARRDLTTGEVFVCDGNWQTNTTKERLNGIPGVRVNQIKGVWYLNGEMWNGEWKKV